MTAILLTTICFLLIAGATRAAHRRRARWQEEVDREYLRQCLSKTRTRKAPHHEFLMGTRHPGDEMRSAFWRHYGR